MMMRRACPLFVLVVFGLALFFCITTNTTDHDQHKAPLLAPASIELQPKPPATLMRARRGPYNFEHGALIYIPTPDFCRSFRCAPHFNQDHGYVVECHDLSFSRTGGEIQVCSGHKGYWRTLYHE